MTKSASKTIVLFNGECPICSAEIAGYKRYAERQGLPLAFESLATADLTDWGLTEAQAARRLHLRRGDEILAGSDAFIALWARMPRWRWLARLVSMPGIRWVADFSYERILAPVIYGWHRRRQAKRAVVPGDTQVRRP